MAFNGLKTREYKDGTTPETGTKLKGSIFNEEFNRLYENDNDLKDNKLEKSGGTISESLTIKKNLIVEGDFDVIGSRSNIEIVDTSITDNIFTLNKGQTGSEVTPSSGFSGIEVNRGSSTSFMFGFFASAGKFVAGFTGSLKKLITEDDVGNASGQISSNNGKENINGWSQYATKLKCKVVSSGALAALIYDNIGQRLYLNNYAGGITGVPTGWPAWTITSVIEGAEGDAMICYARSVTAGDYTEFRCRVDVNGATYLKTRNEDGSITQLSSGLNAVDVTGGILSNIKAYMKTLSAQQGASLHYFIADAVNSSELPPNGATGWIFITVKSINNAGYSVHVEQMADYSEWAVNYNWTAYTAWAKTRDGDGSVSLSSGLITSIYDVTASRTTFTTYTNTTGKTMLLYIYLYCTKASTLTLGSGTVFSPRQDLSYRDEFSCAIPPGDTYTLSLSGYSNEMLIFRWTEIY